MIVTEAAHIIPFSMCNSETCYDVNNGLLLSANLHKLFDSYKMSINKSGHVVFSHDVLADKLYIDAHDFNNKHIKLNDKTMKNLNIHYNLFLCVEYIFTHNNLFLCVEYIFTHNNLFLKNNNV